MGYDEPLDSIEACQLVVDELVTSDWWVEQFAATPPITVVDGGWDDQDLGLIASYAHALGYPTPKRWEISMHPSMLRKRVLLHEVAHCAAPVFVVAGTGGSSRHRKHLAHGPHFARALAAITGYVVGVAADELAMALAHFEAPIAAPIELSNELALQPGIYAHEEKEWAETQAFFAAADADADAEAMAEGYDASSTTRVRRSPGIVPTITWGDYFEMMRRDTRKRSGGPFLSQKRLAAMISAVTPCSPHHIAELDHTKSLPTDPSQLRRAMLAMICMGVDPIWTRYNMRLTRWDCGDISLDEARVLNPGWADLVERINSQQQQRPPRWHVDGAR
ncbi:SprT family zinc-dependent metalloprotease [Rhodococcus sp. 14-2470-1b]|uniref:SprT family zinc-dependent metalloprotease n=1 Tax=Rhodococcus sp. 14-2470-1b TaxID=2023149 RepID=UPI00113FEF45|nr:SprT family zinc-dependent metalloprotease [Rhodococcus sp. 14-2470-1b]